MSKSKWLRALTSSGRLALEQELPVMDMGHSNNYLDFVMRRVTA